MCGEFSFTVSVLKVNLGSMLDLSLISVRLLEGLGSVTSNRHVFKRNEEAVDLSLRQVAASLSSSSL